MTAKTPWADLRRIITGVDDDGHSRVIVDDNLPNRFIHDDGEGLHDVCTDPVYQLVRRAINDQTDRTVTIAPRKNGVRYKTILELPLTLKRKYFLKSNATTNSTQ